MTEHVEQGAKQANRPWWWRKKQAAQQQAAAKKQVAKAEPPKPKGNAAFIDSQNLNLGVQKAGWKMDWHKFREWLRTEYNVTQAYMFIGYMQENEALYEQMYEHGFLVVLKPTLDITTIRPEDKPGEKQPPKTGKDEKSPVKDEKPPFKGNIDTDLVLYAMKELPNYDKALIVSGDGDFFSLLEYLNEQGKLLKLLAPNWQYSTLLKSFEPYVVELGKHRNELAYRDHRRPRQHGPAKPRT